MSSPLPVNATNPTRYGACELRDASFKSANLVAATGGVSVGVGNLKEKINSNNNNTNNLNGSPDESTADEEAALESPVEQKTFILRLADRIPCLGILMALCASFFLGSAGMLVKMTRSVHGIQVAVLRAYIQLLVYGYVVWMRRLPLLPERAEFWPVMGRAFLGACSITFSYYALKLIPLGDATTIRFSLPIWTLIISYLVLNESCNLFKFGAVIVSVSGVVLIAKPDDCVYLLHLIMHSINLESEEEFLENYNQWESLRALEFPVEADDVGLLKVGASEPSEHEPYLQFEGSLLALSSSIFLSMSLVALRLCRNTPAEITILWLSIISIGIGTTTLLALGKWCLPNNWPDVFFIILNGLCGSIGQWFITNALKVEQSGVISLARTVDIEVAFLYSAFLLHEHIRLTSIIGSILVSCGVLAVVIPKWLEARSESRLQRQLQQQTMIGQGRNSSGPPEGDNHLPTENGRQSPQNLSHSQRGALGGKQ